MAATGAESRVPEVILIGRVKADTLHARRRTPFLTPPDNSLELNMLAATIS